MKCIAQPIWLLMLLNLFAGLPIGCTAQPGAAPDETEPTPTRTDYELFELVALDLLDSDEFPGRKPRSTIVVGDQTRGATSGCGDVGRKDRLIPAEICTALKKRNWENPISLRNFKPSNPKVLVTDVRTAEGIIEFEGAFPDARCYVEAWLPGNSDDGMTAVLTAEIGPSMHGASATWMLVNNDGLWKVKWREVSRFQ